MTPSTTRLIAVHHGSFDDVPLERLQADFAKFYPGWGGVAGDLTNADFEIDISKEVRS